MRERGKIFRAFPVLCVGVSESVTASLLPFPIHAFLEILDTGQRIVSCPYLTRKTVEFGHAQIGDCKVVPSAPAQCCHLTGLPGKLQVEEEGGE